MRLDREYTVGYLGPVTVVDAVINKAPTREWWGIQIPFQTGLPDPGFPSSSLQGKIVFVPLISLAINAIPKDISFRCDFSCSFHLMFYTAIDKTVKSVQFPGTGFSHILMTITTREFRNTQFLFQKQIRENRGAAKLGQRST